MIEQQPLRLINGRYANSKNVIGCCHMFMHRGFLSKDLVKAHACLEKECWHFQKLNPEYWRILEKKAQDKRDKRMQRKLEINRIQNRDALIRETLEASGHIHVTVIREEKQNMLIISYIYDRYIDLTQEIRYLQNELDKVVKLQARIGPEQVIELLIRKPRRETRKITDVRKAPKVGFATKKRLAALGVYCLEDLFGRNGDALYRLDCKESGQAIDRRYLTAYRSAVAFADQMI
jgi:hypothetical protein